MDFNIYRLLGVIVGISLGLVICFVAFKLMNKNGKLKTEYDEMQTRVRGNAYKYGFWTISIYLGFLVVLSSGDIILPIEPMVIYFFGFFLGGVVLCLYSIFKGAYFGLNNVKRRWYVFMIFFGVYNLFIAGIAISKGEMIVNGVLSTPFINILCGVMILIAFFASKIKEAVDRHSESEDN